MFPVAVLGAGRMGQIHAGNAAADPRLELRYVADSTGAAAGELAARTGAKALADAAAAIDDPEIQGVVVATSTDSHLELTLKCLAAGKQVFCEKPLDLDLAKCRVAEPVLSAARDQLFLAFNRRFDPHYRALKAKLDAGAVGRIESLNIVNHDPAAPPPAFVPRSGGLYKDFTIHDFDMARWLLDEEPAEVFAAASCLVDPEIGRQGDVDTCRVILKTPSGKLCAISNTRRSGCGYDQRLEAFGERGMVRVGNVAQAEMQVWDEAGASAAPIHFGFVDRYALSYRGEMSHFAAMLAGEETPRAGYADSIAALVLAEAAAESARTGAMVRV